MHGWKRIVLAALVAGVTGTAMGTDRVPVEAFARFSKLSSPRLSPDGKYLSANAELGNGNYALAVYRLADMVQTAHLKFPKYELPVQVVWVSDTRLVIAKGRASGSLEKPYANGEIIATNFDGTQQKYIYGYEQRTRSGGLDRGFGQIVSVPEQRNGHFYMRQLTLNARSSSIYDVDTETTVYKQVAQLDTPDLEFVLDHDSVPRFAYGVDLDDNTLLFGNDGKGKWSPVSFDSVGGKWIPMAFTPDNTTAYGYFSQQGGPAQFVSSDLTGGNRKVLAADAAHAVEDTQWTAAPYRPFAVRTGRGLGQFTYLMPESPDAQLHLALSKALPGRRVDFIDQSKDGQVILLRVDSDRDPGAWYLLRRNEGKLRHLLTGREGIDPQRMGERRAMQFTTSDGVKLDTILTLPPGVTEARGLPMVLLPHGGPHYVEDDWFFDSDAQFLASRGYLVLQVNFRGSSGRGSAFERAGYRQWGTRVQDDLIEGVRWAVAQGIADPARVCVYGASFGAYSAMMAPIRAPGMFKCAAGLAGVYDLQMMKDKGDIQQSESGRRYLQRVLGNDASALQASSPARQAAQLRIPVLLAHGEEDERAPLAQAKAMRAALTAAGNAPEWHTYAKEGHGFYNEDNSIDFYRALDAFLARNLGPGAQ